MALDDTEMSGGGRRQTIILTGFGPFPGVADNASIPFVHALAPLIERHLPGVRAVVEELPTAWGRIGGMARQLGNRSDGDVLLHFGVSRRIDGFVIETQAQNAAKSQADIDGDLPAEPQLVAGAPEHLKAGRIAIHGALRLASRHLPVDLSDDAGRYLCNALYYNVLWQRRRQARQAPVLFVHLPVELGSPSVLPVQTALVCGLELAATCVESVGTGVEIDPGSKQPR